MSRPRFSPLLLLGAVLALGVLALTLGDAQSARASAGNDLPKAPSSNDPRLQKAWVFDDGGWTYVHLEGSPAEIGFQHGYLLADKIADLKHALEVQDTYRTKRDWGFFRDTAKNILWPHIEAEYRQELEGIVEGMKARGESMDIWDLVAVNAFLEVPDYYLPWLDKQQHAKNAPLLAPPSSCSAFVATGSYTRDHQPVMAHSAWTGYVSGARWRIVFDIVPASGYRMLMDGLPGIITSDDDFGVNTAGLMITETTITQFFGFDPNGKPEFVRSRKALQYANSIDDYVRIMEDGNNGGYANDWLLADRKTGEIARLELGLKHTRVWRSKDGYLVGSNFPSDPALTRDETTFDVHNLSNSANARHVRWDQLMKQYKGQIDTTLAEKFESDHYDSWEKKHDSNERTLCGHIEDSSRGAPEAAWGPYFPGGAAQAKVMDSQMAKDMSFVARAGHPCGANFSAAEFLKAHPEYDWQKSVLPDMDAGPWTAFRAGEKK